MGGKPPKRWHYYTGEQEFLIILPQGHTVFIFQGCSLYQHLGKDSQEQKQSVPLLRDVHISGLWLVPKDGVLPSLVLSPHLFPGVHLSSKCTPEMYAKCLLMILVQSRKTTGISSMILFRGERSLSYEQGREAKGREVLFVLKHCILMFI